MGIQCERKKTQSKLLEAAPSPCKRALEYGRPRYHVPLPTDLPPRLLPARASDHACSPRMEQLDAPCKRPSSCACGGGSIAAQLHKHNDPEGGSRAEIRHGPAAEGSMGESPAAGCQGGIEACSDGKGYNIGGHARRACGKWYGRVCRGRGWEEAEKYPQAGPEEAPGGREGCRCGA